ANYIAENTIKPTPGGGSFDSVAFRGDDTNMVEVNNIFGSTCSFTPQNTMKLEHIGLGLFEGNQTSMGDPFFTGVHVIAQHIVVRNNLFQGTDVAVSVEGHPLLSANWVTGNIIENNTVYRPSSVTQGGPVPCFVKDNTSGTLTVENNICWEGTTFGT